MKKSDPHVPKHLSKFKTCQVCKEEFWAKTATICRDCQRRLANRSNSSNRRKKYEETYKYISDEGVVIR